MSRTVRPTGFADWTDADLSSIAMQAKHAFERGRLKSCLAGTRILLQADPENQEARALQAAIRIVIEDDLRNAEELLANPRLEDQPEVFGAGAEIILRRILDLDPENDRAKLLIDKLNGKVVEPLPPRPQPQPQPSTAASAAATAATGTSATAVTSATGTSAAAGTTTATTAPRGRASDSGSTPADGVRTASNRTVSIRRPHVSCKGVGCRKEETNTVTDGLCRHCSLSGHWPCGVRKATTATAV